MGVGCIGGAGVVGGAGVGWRVVERGLGARAGVEIAPLRRCGGWAVVGWVGTGVGVKGMGD